MKKFLIYSSSITGATIILGILFVYGVFDFTEGKSQLIGPTHLSSYEMDLHNDIVEYTHGLGNLMMDTQATIGAFEDGGDLGPFNQKFEQIKRENDLLDSLMQNSVFESEQEAIQTEYFETYRPALVSWINSAAEIIKAYAPPEEVVPEEQIAVEGEEVVAEEPPTEPEPINLPALKETLQGSYIQFIEAHNEYIDVLNKRRKY
ncbi:hypothetical protein ACFL3C_01285 [Patescibacteria group bacterium]